MATNIFKDLNKAETGQPAARRNIFKDFSDTPDAPRNIFKETTSRLKEQAPAYTIASRIKRDALIRPDAQMFLDLVTGGKSKEFLESNVGKDVVDIPVQGALGFTSGATFGLPELLTADFIPNYVGKEVGKEVLKPESAIGDVIKSISSLLGMGKAIRLFAKLKPAKALANLKPSTWQGVLAKRVVDGGFKLGAYSALSAHGGASLMENIKSRGVAGMHGAALGSVFSMVHAITGDVVAKAAGKLGLKVTDPATHITAFATRLGINEYFTGIESFKKYVHGEEHLPGLAYNIGLGVMFSLSNSPLRLEAEFNKTIKHKYGLSKMTPTELATNINKYDSHAAIPADIKWAYIMKATNGRIRPTYQNSGDMLKFEEMRLRLPEDYTKALNRGQVTTNIGATDHIFEHVLSQNAPKVYDKFNFLRNFKQDAQEAFEVALGNSATTEQVAIRTGTVKEPAVAKEVMGTHHNVSPKFMKKQARVMQAISDQYNIPMADIPIKFDNKALRSVLESNPNAQVKKLVQLWHDRVLMPENTALAMTVDINEARGMADQLSKDWSRKCTEILEYHNAKWYEKKDTMNKAMFKKWISSGKDKVKPKKVIGIKSPQEHTKSIPLIREYVKDTVGKKSPRTLPTIKLADMTKTGDYDIKSGTHFFRGLGWIRDETAAKVSIDDLITKNIELGKLDTRATGNVDGLYVSPNYAGSLYYTGTQIGKSKPYGLVVYRVKKNIKMFHIKEGEISFTPKLGGKGDGPYSRAHADLIDKAYTAGFRGKHSTMIREYLISQGYDAIQISSLHKRAGLIATTILDPKNALEVVAADKYKAGAEFILGGEQVKTPTGPVPEVEQLQPAQKSYNELRAEADTLWKAARKAATTAHDLVKSTRNLRAKELRDERAKMPRVAEPQTVEKQVTEITTTVRKGDRVISTGTGTMVDNTMEVGSIETQPDFRTRGADSRVLRKLMDEGLKKNPNLDKVNGNVSTKDAYEVARKFGAKFMDDAGNEIPAQAVGVVTGTGSKRKFGYTIDVRSNDFALSTEGKSLPDLSWTPQYTHTQEGNLRAELATGKDITSLKRIAKHVGLLYKSKNNKDVSRNLTKFLSSYFDTSYSDVKKLTKTQIAEAKKFMGQLVPDSKGKIELPRTAEILPIEYFDKHFNTRGNIFDWLQSGRVAIKPIYDVFKPAYQELLVNRTAKINELNGIYKGRVKRGSVVDKKLASYANGTATLKSIPEQYRDIAISRQKFYDGYADRLVEAGLLDRHKVFNKDGTRKQYFHRVFDGTMERAFNDGFALEDVWLPGKLAKASALKERRGGKTFKESALESDVHYVSGIEKYLAMKDANEVALAYAKQYRGMKQEMARVYIRSMRGQPTKLDQQITETWTGVNHVLADLLDGVGMKKQASGLRKSQAPTYPISRVTSPLARVYYWRYVGLALDTAMKNSIQWQHAMARYGIDNTSKAFYGQFTEKGKNIIKAADIHAEGIQRGGHFIAEADKPSKLSQIEEASYFLWTQFDKNNRNVSGLAAYYDAIGKGKMPQQAIVDMKKASHETQFGYTKADSLLIDMASPLSRFVMFKKWPLAKIEMIRTWVKEGHSEALFNLAMQEYMLYRVAQGAGIDMGKQLNAIWSFATRGISSPADMIPVAGEVTDIAQMFTGDERAKERVINAWQGFGNRYVGKVINFTRAWHDDWNVTDHAGQLKYKSNPNEQAINLFSRSLESTKRMDDIKNMSMMKEDIRAMKGKISRLALNGNAPAAAKLNRDMMDKYAQDMVDYYGKELQPVDLDAVVRFAAGQKTTAHERLRKSLPGKEVIKVPAGAELKGKPRKVRNIFRGY